MDDMIFCQSCGMPMEDSGALSGTNADGSKNADYCKYCFENGAFIDDVTMEEMIATCVPHMTATTALSEAQAAEMLRNFLPTLKRWK